MAEAPHFPAIWPPLREELPRAAALAALADRQHGVVSMGQLRELGLSGRAVRDRVAAGSLHRIHRGVYAVGRRGLTIEGFRMAAVLACGPRAVLSHRAAAAHLGLRPDNRPRVDVTVPRRSGRRRHGIDVHVSTTLAPEDVIVHRGIPCASVARTLVDLGDVVERRGVERAVEQAEVLRVFDLEAVEAALARAGPRRGAGLIRGVLGKEHLGLTASELEERFLQICRKTALPQPAVNEWIAIDAEEFKVDFLWSHERLIAETDGRETHGTKAAFERDRRRDQLVKLAGYDVVRFTWRQVAREPAHVARTLTALLGR